MIEGQLAAPTIVRIAQNLNFLASSVTIWAVQAWKWQKLHSKFQKCPIFHWFLHFWEKIRDRIGLCDKISI